MYVLLICGLLSLTASQASIVRRAFNCGGLDYLTTNNGVIVSHGGFEANHHYGKNMDCVWRIEAPVGMKVELVSEAFDVEDDPACAYDYLTLYDGNSTQSSSMGKYCGMSFSPISSSGRFITLQFITDDDTQQSGFKLHYNFTTEDIHSCPSSNFKCANGKCIDDSYRCDNDDDCGDDSDELNCNGQTNGNGSCDATEFTCGNGNCVPTTWLCDGDDDCNDNSDELTSNCNAGTSGNTAMCGVTNQTGDAGTLSSPGFPQNYPSDTNCVYVVQAPSGTKSIAFKFDDTFGIEDDATCSYDYVLIHGDGHTFKHGPFCGTVSPGQFTVPSDHAFIEFVSDDSDNYSGFRLDWKALQTRSSRKQKRFINDAITTTVTPSVDCIYEMNITDDGTLLSPGYGITNYPPSTICKWTLYAPENRTIRIHFNDFRIENTRLCRDYVRIFDGDTSFSNILGDICGRYIPNDIVTTDNTAVILFYSDNDRHEDKGFNITYSVDAFKVSGSVYIVEEGCNGDVKYLNESRGYISSPEYDGVIPYANDQECRWLIEAPPGKVVVIKFQDFLTERIDGCSYDYVAVYDGMNDLSKKLAQLCGLQFPEDIISTGSYMFVQFTSDADVAGTGFNLTYEFRSPVDACDRYQCGDGSCILHQMVCNGHIECMDHTDEVVCVDGNCGRPHIPPAETNYKIVGGREAIPNSWPWMVSLRVDDKHTCGGALIDESWVITAAHCFEANRRISDWSAAVGKHHELKQELTTQVRSVERIIVNTQYNFLTTNNDIALVKLDKPFKMNTYVSTICLPETDVAADMNGFVTGWGFIGATCCPGVLKQAMIPVISNQKCNQPDYLGPQITSSMFCAGYDAGGLDACQGDSGGPFVVKENNVWHIQGITSFGSGCADPKSPGVYTRVYHFLDWIRQKIAMNSFNVVITGK